MSFEFSPGFYLRRKHIQIHLCYEKLCELTIVAAAYGFTDECTTAAADISGTATSGGRGSRAGRDAMGPSDMINS
jgi:hypothetical protein